MTLESEVSDPNKPLYYPRGIYRVLDHYLKVEDWCGFFEYRLPSRLSGETSAGRELTVYPGQEQLLKGTPLQRDRIPEKRAFLSWLKDREFFDARPYYPGDDPRRINWKMLARHDELFIREGNSLSPSRKSALLLLDGSGSEVDSDRMYRILSALVEQLKEAGLKITAALPGMEPVRGLEAFPIRKKEDLLAAPLPGKSPSLQALEQDRFGMIYFFCSRHPGPGELSAVEQMFKDSVKVLVLPGVSGGGVSKASAGRWKIVSP
ncbi:MAG: DUF58 domain-containing protein [Spirochaetales bacterium]|nr:DUF58 domain-containing protein [Spirochaetales bacterium]